MRRGPAGGRRSRCGRSRAQGGRRAGYIACARVRPGAGPHGEARRGPIRSGGGCRGEPPARARVRPHAQKAGRRAGAGAGAGRDGKRGRGRIALCGCRQVVPERGKGGDGRGGRRRKRRGGSGVPRVRPGAGPHGNARQGPTCVQGGRRAGPPARARVRPHAQEAGRRAGAGAGAKGGCGGGRQHRGGTRGRGRLALYGCRQVVPKRGKGGDGRGGRRRKRRGGSGVPRVRPGAGPHGAARRGPVRVQGGRQAGRLARARVRPHAQEAGRRAGGGREQAPEKGEKSVRGGPCAVLDCAGRRPGRGAGPARSRCNMRGGRQAQGGGGKVCRGLRDGRGRRAQRGRRRPLPCSLRRVVLRVRRQARRARQF